MMKNKSKKQEDEGSTQSNASRYDLMYFTPFWHLLWLYTLTSMVDHLCMYLNGNFEDFLLFRIIDLEVAK